jgi:hypothetical protein
MNDINNTVPDHSLVPIELEMKRFMQTADELTTCFDEQVSIAPPIDNGFGLDEMKELYKTNREHVEASSIGLSETDYLRAIRECELQGITDFMNKIVQEDAVLPPSNKAIIRAYREYLKTHINLSKFRVNTYANLSSFGNSIV